MPQSRFSFTPARFKEIAAEVVAQARARGASAAETEVSESIGQSVTVRQGEVETIEYTRDKGVSITVYIAQQRGHVSSSDLSAQAISDAVDKALTIARFTAADDCAGLADEDLLARDFPDLDLYRPWGIGVDQAIELARACEAAAFAVDKRITNSEGASVGTHDAHFIYANSLGFMAGFPSSRHHLACAVIAGKDDSMQRDDWYTSGRDPDALEKADAVGTMAGQRALRRLGARKIDTTQAPVVFEAPLATGLLGHFVSAASGGNLYRKASFLVDALGKPIFAPGVTISERPHVPRGLASTAFDDEGVATKARNVVEAGVLRGYFLGTYSGRKLGMRSTGNAGGNHNLLLEPGDLDLTALLERMGRGLLVTELLGMGVNTVTGDYSRGAAGFWVESGKIAFPVQEVTIASNLKDMFLGIEAVGSDVVVRGSRASGSVLLAPMTIAGD
ncbi:MAG: metalloprotease PmbA [Betaproteobacteria bacterium]|nr:MAG: metalloprotease PmbA [Betaproteobacteria bacterium]